MPTRPLLIDTSLLPMFNHENLAVKIKATENALTAAPATGGPKHHHSTPPPIPHHTTNPRSKQSTTSTDRTQSTHVHASARCGCCLRTSSLFNHAPHPINGNGMYYSTEIHRRKTDELTLLRTLTASEATIHSVSYRTFPSARSTNKKK